MKIDYTRCENCGFVYNKTLKKCPKCDTSKPINEDLNNNEPVFNILD